MYEGHEFLNALPFDIPRQKRKPKLQTMLFTAHAVATAANAGKVLFLKNPLAINLPQWLLFVKYSYQQLKWSIFTKENERQEAVQEVLNDDWEHVNDQLKRGFEFKI